MQFQYGFKRIGTVYNGSVWMYYDYSICDEPFNMFKTLHGHTSTTTLDPEYNTNIYELLRISANYYGPLRMATNDVWSYTWVMRRPDHCECDRGIIYWQHFTDNHVLLIGSQFTTLMIAMTGDYLFVDTFIIVAIWSIGAKPPEVYEAFICSEDSARYRRRTKFRKIPGYFTRMPGV